MASAWLQANWQSDAIVDSAGLQALIGYPADELAVAVAAEHGLDLNSHRAKQVTESMIRESDLILVMESSQREQILRIAPLATGKVWRMGHHAGQDIVDPYRRGRVAFEQSFQSIASLGKSWLPFTKVP